jgi:hypothetical protein
MKNNIVPSSKASFLYSKYTHGYMTKNQYLKAYDTLVKEIKEKVSSTRRSLCIGCSKELTRQIVVDSVCSPECWFRVTHEGER